MRKRPSRWRSPGWWQELRNGIGMARLIPDLGPYERARWIAAASLLPWSSRRRWPFTIGVPARLPNGSTIVLRVTHAGDLAVIFEVLYKGQYAAPELDDPKVIVDAGSHIGSSVAWFASRYPSSRVIGLEPSAKVCECLRYNVRFFPNVEIHNVALGPADGYAPFYERRESCTSSLQSADDGAQGVMVPVLSLESALRLAGPGDVDLLKLDIEGAEYDVLRACLPDPQRVRRIVGELHTWMADVGFTTPEFLALLDAYQVEEDCSAGEHVFRALPSS